MRTETARNVTAKLVDHLQIADIEEAILQTGIPMLGQRRTNTGDCLPREARIGIVQEVGCEDRLNRNACNTCTAADEALQAIVVTEVEHTIGHEAQCVRVAIQRRIASEERARRARRNSGVEKRPPVMSASR